MQERCARRGATGTLAPAPALRRLREWRRRRLVDLLEPLCDARGREREPWPRTRAEAHGAQLSSVLIHPPAGLAVQAGDLGGVDERLGLFRHENAEPNRKPIRQEVGQPVERRIVVVSGLAVGTKRGTKRDKRLRCQRPYVLCDRETCVPQHGGASAPTSGRLMKAPLDRSASSSLSETGIRARYSLSLKRPR